MQETALMLKSFAICKCGARSVLGFPPPLSHPVLRLSKMLRQMIAFWSLVWRHCDALPGVAEHPVSPIVDTGNARRPPRIANFLHIIYNKLIVLNCA